MLYSFLAPSVSLIAATLPNQFVMPLGISGPVDSGQREQRPVDPHFPELFGPDEIRVQAVADRVDDGIGFDAIGPGVMKIGSVGFGDQTVALIQPSGVYTSRPSGESPNGAVTPRLPLERISHERSRHDPSMSFPEYSFIWNEAVARGPH
jgi:hypothetical protein